jgi:hypothetical protein
MRNYCITNNFAWISKPACQSFFNQYPEQANFADTQPAVMTFCTRDRNMEIGQTGEFCRNLVSRMIRISGSSPVIDNSLTAYCTESRGVTLANFANQPTDLQAVCNCHLSAEDYASYEQSLKQDFPALNTITLGDVRCLLNGCAGSDFPSVQTAPVGACPGVQCIQAISNQFTNTVTNNIINDQAGICAQLNTNVNSSAFSPDQTPTPTQAQVDAAATEQNTALTVSLSIVIPLVVITGVVLAVLYARGTFPLPDFIKTDLPAVQEEKTPET